MRVATLANAGHDRRRCRLGSAIATSSMQCATPSRRAQQAKTDLTRFDRVKNLNMGSFHIHRRGFFSSITAQVAAAVIPPSATSSKTSSGVPIGVILSNYCSPRRSDFYPKAQIHKWPSKKCRSLSKKVEFGQTFVQELLVESGCRMSQRFFAHSFGELQPWRFAYHCRERRPRTPPTDTSAAGCECAA